ncbi:MAG: hypothetical protein ABSB01_05690 [Streptosporangiaceae bacterium]
MTGERQAPLYCPYCGDEDLRPSGPDAGGWRCGACARGFVLRFAGLTTPGADPSPTDAGVAARIPAASSHPDRPAP